MLASSKIEERAYARDRDISMWRPLPTDDCHVDVRCSYFYWPFWWIANTGDKRQSKHLIWHIAMKACIHIAKFIARVGGGLFTRQKKPVQELGWKWEGGLYATYSRDTIVIKVPYSPEISPLPSLTSKFLHRYFYLVYKPPPYTLQKVHHQQKERQAIDKNVVIRSRNSLTSWFCRLFLLNIMAIA